MSASADDLRALIDRLRRPYQDPLVREITTAAADALARLAAVERDAERMRALLREVLHATSPNMSMDMYAKVCAAIAARKGEV